MQLRALWFTKSLQLDSHCLPKFRTQVPGVYLGWVLLKIKRTVGLVVVTGFAHCGLRKQMRKLLV